METPDEQSLFLASLIKGTELGRLPPFLTQNSWLQFDSTASIIQSSGSKWDEVGANGGSSTQGTQYRYPAPSGPRAKGNTMFLGQYERSLDDKGRLAIPVELRAGLGPRAVLTRSFDNCLAMYPADKWNALAHSVEDLPQVRTEVRALARSLFGGAVPCEFDRQGRVTIPAFLREHASLTTDAMVVGVNSRVEIWAKEAFLQEQQRFEDDGSEFAAVLTVS